MSETSSGSDPEIDIHLGEGYPPGFPAYEPVVEPHLNNRPDIHIPQDMQNLQDEINFRPYHGRWHIVQDIVGLIRHRENDSKETYLDKLARETERGKSESSTYGIGTIDGQDAVVYAMHWDFFAGSLGVVAGEKFQAAVDLAVSKKLPFVSIYASSGVRQHENFAGLAQMTRMVEAIRHYKEHVRAPHIAVLLGNVWGGVSASAVPNADVILATAGTNYGFAGPNVIEAFERAPVPEGSQSAEANMLDRNIDVILPDVPATVGYIGQLLRSTSLPDKHHRLQEESAPLIRNVTPPDQGRSFAFYEDGLHGPGDSSADTAQYITLRPRVAAEPKPREDALMDQYQALMSDANRADLDLVSNFVFGETVPLYNHIQDGDIKRYPAIVGAVARIGMQPFIVVGTQPSYRRIGDTVIKQPANPGPEDFEYMERVMDMGERLALPALLITDTLGAKPTLESERRGQSRAIARSILRGLDYEPPVLSLVTGALGSGGGLATTALSDHVMMLEHAMAFVAEPRSAASILYRTPNPTHEQVRTTLATMRSTAHDQKQLGLIDEVIPEHMNPYQTAEHITAAVVRAYVRLAELPAKKLHARRQQRVRELRAFEIVRD